MRVKLLGTAAGGGYPQWNCNCRNCRGLRSGELKTRSRLQSSLAVQSGEGPWVLVNASPDIRSQLALFLPPPPEAPVRTSRVGAILLTDSQLDHTAGLLLLRESPEPLKIYCADTAHEDLMADFPVLRMLGSYAGVERHPLPPGDLLELPELPGVGLQALPLAGKAPPYSGRRGRESAAESLALVFTEQRTGRRLLYAPALASIDGALEPHLLTSDVLLIDGTLWTDDEMARTGCGRRTGREMGHWPLGGQDGLLERLKPARAHRKILVHVNNTNPVLDEGSPEHAALATYGVELGYDGLELTL